MQTSHKRDKQEMEEYEDDCGFAYASDYACV